MFEIALLGVHGYFKVLTEEGPKFLEPRVEAGMVAISGQRGSTEMGYALMVRGMTSGGLEGRGRSKEIM